jgi:predicted negative regulator of RcsB-dependent stress response
MAQDKASEAVKAFQEIVDSPESRYLAPYALISIGDIAHAAGDTTKAESAYRRVVAEFSDSNFAETANLRLSNLKAKDPKEVAAPPTEAKPATAPGDKLVPGALPAPTRTPEKP